MKEKPEVLIPAGKHLEPSTAANSHYDSQTLFCGRQEIMIHHAGHAYRLRITRQDKLILTK